jgi:hypothetical protein
VARTSGMPIQYVRYAYSVRQVCLFSTSGMPISLPRTSSGAYVRYAYSKLRGLKATSVCGLKLLVNAALSSSCLPAGHHRAHAAAGVANGRQVFRGAAGQNVYHLACRYV